MTFYTELINQFSILVLFCCAYRKNTTNQAEKQKKEKDVKIVSKNSFKFAHFQISKLFSILKYKHISSKILTLRRLICYTKFFRQ